MTNKPAWQSRINEIAETIRALPEDRPYDSAAVQTLLDVQPRAAQEILAPIVEIRKGRKGYAPAGALLARLRELAGGLDAEQEQQRRQNFAWWLREQETQIATTPRMLVEAHPRVTGSRIDSIDGLELGPGRLSLTFQTAEEAAQKLLALAMAMGRDWPEFESRVLPQPEAMQSKTSSPDAA
jgi:hypothetical protein